jgi:hypothetical protein
MLDFSRLKMFSRDTAPNFDVEAHVILCLLRMKILWLSRASVEKPNAES